MKTLFISGNDTEIGKTWVVRSLVALLSQTGASVQVVKPIQTGVPPGSEGDVEFALNGSKASGTVWHSFSLPLAPLTAAAHEGSTLSLEQLCQAKEKLPNTDWCLIEGAGGLAVPVDPKGYDWADFAHCIEADGVLLVVEDRLGAINQSRLLDAYAHAKKLPAGFWLNEVHPQSKTVHQSNLEALCKLKAPLYAVQRFNRREPEILSLQWRTWLGLDRELKQGSHGDTGIEV